MTVVRNTLALSLVLLAALAATGRASAANEQSFHFSPTPKDMYDLDHYDYYKWGINWVIPNGQVITGAKLFFDNIRNWDNNANVLYGALLDTKFTGLRDYSDNQGNGNAFAGETQLFQWNNLPTTPQDLTYVFDDAELAKLTEYLDNNYFGIGLDPDCHYYNDGIKLTITTEDAYTPPPPPPPPPPTNGVVPEPLTALTLLLGAPVLGLAATRRRNTR